MAFTLKTVLDDGGVGISVGLDYAHKLLQAQIMAHKSNAKIKEFENYLNSIFYPKKIGGSANDAFVYYQTAMQAENEDVITSVLNSFDFESNTGDKGYYKGQTGIQFGSLQREINSIEEALTKVQDSGKLSPEIIDKVKNITERGRNLLTAAEKVFPKSRAGLSKRVIQGDLGQEAIKVANQLRGLSAAITGGISPQQAGILFEMALEKADYYRTASEDTRNDIVKEILSNYYSTLSKGTLGAQKVSRGVGGINLNMSVQKHIDKIDKSTAKNFSISDERIKITYNYNPNEMKMGKMDVQMNFGGGPVSDYRVSAKRWTSKNFAHNFGSTSIDAGITRSGGYGVAEAYKFAVLNPPRDLGNGGKVNTGNSAAAAHEFAKLALKADILMGINQGTALSGAGYANLVVIDTGSRIIVENLVDLMNSNKINLKDYYPGSIEGEAIKVYNGLTKEMGQGRSIEYLQKMTSVLNKMKVSIEYNGI